MFNTEEDRQNYERARDLRRKVEEFVNREFNFIRVSVYEACNPELYEHIRQEPASEYIDDYLYNLSDEDKRDLEEEIQEELDIPVNDEVMKEYILEYREDDVREWADDNRYVENYPIWSTLFEFRSEPPESWITAAQEVGLGVIDPQFEFNTTLFSTSAGHSFYSSYWIPLYLKIFDYEKEKWANIDFSMV